MLNLLELALNNNFIYIGIIIVLIIVIIITILSIKKDRDKALKERLVVEPIHDEKEKEQAKLELEKVMSEMQKNLENKENMSKVESNYEQEQEEQAIISYKELVDSVKNNDLSEDKEIDITEIDITKDIPSVENDTVKEKTTEDIINEVIKEKEVANMEKTEVSFTDLDNMDEELIEVPETKTTEHKFQTSEFISPIFGTGPQSDFRKTEPVSEEIKHSNIETRLDDIIDEDFDDEDEFLDSLKDFRKNL